MTQLDRVCHRILALPSCGLLSQYYSTGYLYKNQNKKVLHFYIFSDSQCMYVLLIGTAYFCLLMFVFLDSCPCASLSTFSPLPYSPFSPLPYSPPHTHVHVRIIIMSNCCSLSFLCYSVGLSHVFSLSCVNTVSVSVRNCTIPYTYINVCCYCHYYIIIIIINILLYISISQTLSLAACGSIYANKIVPVRHNAHYSAFVYSACTESEREYGILLNLCTFNYLGYVVQQSNINAVLHCLKHNDGK